MTIENQNIPDTWSTGSGYISRYQTPEQVKECLALLDLDSAQTLADLGCGNGVFAVSAAVRYPCCKVWAFDPLVSAIEECRRRAAAEEASNLQAGLASANELPLPASSVDRVLMRNVLHHVACAETVYAEIARVLSPRGVLVLEGPCNQYDRRFGEFLSDLHMLMDASHRRTYHRPEDVASGLALHGIMRESITCWPYSNGVSEEQVHLRREHCSENELALDQQADGRWTIRLYLMRIVARRTVE